MDKSLIFIILIYFSSIADSTFNLSSIVLDETDDIKMICKARKCIRKCCQKDHYFIKSNGSCERLEGKFDFANLPVYDDYDHSLKINKTLSEIFLLVPGKFFETFYEENSENQTFAEIMYVFSDYNYSTYLTESGNLYMESPNAYIRWSRIDHFCIEYEVDETVIPKYWTYIENDSLEKPNIYHTIALLVSSVFLLIVLIVYILLPELRNLVGLILMAYVLSLMGAFISLASLQIGEYSDAECLCLTAVTYFSFLATFCWMNVMSYDIWWTFRGYAKARPIHRRGEKFKFAMYCLYAWGIPLLMAVGLVVIGNTDLSHMPWFIKPQVPQLGCFIEGGQKLVYLYIPMLILIISNWLFFLLTAFNIWRLNRSTVMLDSACAGSPAAHRNQRNRLMVYLKLSVIMGLNWLLEVVSFLTPTLYIWNFTDLYNLLIGVLIFWIFVCKKKTYRGLHNRYCGYFSREPRLRKSHTSSSTIESNVSQDIPLQVSTNPNGLNGQEF
ncbi:unnamed protein product [Euphydryas editha]|uniref:G-protein coupled receptors family 2 profile 2 domain-containing protein n=1 Tax=Euphydryas editha TaxID=104508 RepID=A0AAU9UE03_EUPED|nr:unnamed protein product [Euphydryas editha]